MWREKEIWTTVSEGFWASVYMLSGTSLKRGIPAPWFFSLTIILNHNWNKKFTLQIVGNFLKSKAFWFYPSTLAFFFIWLALSIGKLLVYLFCMLLAAQEKIMQKHYGFETLAAILVIFIGMWLAAGELVYGKCC